MAADLEAAGSAAEVAPVAQGAFWDAEEAAGFLEGEQVVAGVLAWAWGVGLCGHGVLLGWFRRRSMTVVVVLAAVVVVFAAVVVVLAAVVVVFAALVVA